MINKIYLLIFCFFAYCLAGEFCFSNDTVWEDLGTVQPVETYLRNISNDSISIDSLALVIDTVKFPKYGLKWITSPEWYRFDNYPLTTTIPYIIEYNKKYKRMHVLNADSLLLDGFFIDKFIFNKEKYSFHDSIVPITIGIVFFSKGYTDTLILNGDYDYYLQDPNNIIVKNKKINSKVIFNRKINEKYLYTCSGKKVMIKNNIYSLGAGLYFSSCYSRKYLLINGNTILTR